MARAMIKKCIHCEKTYQATSLGQQLCSLKCVIDRGNQKQEENKRKKSKPKRFKRLSVLQ